MYPNTSSWPSWIVVLHSLFLLISYTSTKQNLLFAKKKILGSDAYLNTYAMYKKLCYLDTPGWPLYRVQHVSDTNTPLTWPRYVSGTPAGVQMSWHVLTLLIQFSIRVDTQGYDVLCLDTLSDTPDRQQTSVAMHRELAPEQQTHASHIDQLLKYIFQRQV